MVMMMMIFINRIGFFWSVLNYRAGRSLATISVSKMLSHEGVSHVCNVICCVDYK